MSAIKLHCSLETTPDDVLRNICDLMQGKELYGLLRASKLLKKRLLSGTLVTGLVWTDDIVLKTVPKISYQFQSLQRFVMVMPPADDRTWHISSDAIMGLPSSLTELRLGFQGAHSVWFKHYCPQKVKLEYQSNITGSEADFEKLNDLKAAFPELRTLELLGENVSIGLRLLSLFSPTLTSAHVHDIRWKPYVVESTFPPNLRQLTLPGCYSLNWDLLAPLTQLEVLRLSNINQPPPEHLPSTLHTLHLGWAEQPWSENALTCFSQLPGLTSLTCGSTKIIPHLPPTLTEARISGSSDVDAQYLRKLPRGLRAFACSRIGGDLSDFGFWPHSLTSLEFAFPSTDNFSPKDPRWLQLPKSITLLRADSHRHHPLDIHPSMLPPLIKRVSTRKYGLQAEVLDYSHLSNLSYFSIALFGPQHTASSPTIQYPPMDLDSSNVEDDSSLPSLSSLSLDPITPPLDTFVFILPNRLTELNWICHHYENTAHMADDWYFQDSFASWLPDSLTAFSCDDARKLSNTFLLNLPKCLHSLILELRPKDIDVLFNSDGYKALPPHLSRLHTVIDPNSDDSFIQYLPRSLKYLEIERLKNFSDNTVQHLPRGLISLHMRHVSRGLTDSSIKHLPNTLETIELEHNKTWTPRALFAHWLPRLSYLDLRANPNFTKSTVVPLAPAHVRIKAKKFYRN